MATKRKIEVPPEVSAYMAAISGRGKGGDARREALSPARRKAIAKKAAAARTQKLTPERRSEIAKKAVAAREAKRATKAKGKSNKKPK